MQRKWYKPDVVLVLLSNSSSISLSSAHSLYSDTYQEVSWGRGLVLNIGFFGIQKEMIVLVLAD